MTVYLINIIITMLLGVSIERSVKRNEINKYRPLLSVFVLLVVWCCIYAFRGLSVGSDTAAYRVAYRLIGSRVLSFRMVMTLDRDWGFTLLEYICYKISGGSWIFFNFAMALLTYVPVLRVIKRYSHNITASLLLFIFTMSFYHGFNGMRQMVAVCFCFYAYYDAFLKNKWIKTTILILVAYSFHSTVMLAIPFFVISKLEIKSTWTKLTFIGLAVAFVFLSRIWGSIISILDDLGQEKIAQDYATLNSRGSSLLRTLVAFAPVSFALPIRRKLKENDEIAEKELVLIIFFALFTLLSMKFWLFSRVALYMGMILIMFIPKFSYIFTNSSAQKMFLIYSMYFFYMLFLLLHLDGGYYPYKLIDFYMV